MPHSTAFRISINLTGSFVKLRDHILKSLALAVRFPRSDSALVERLVPVCSKVNDFRILKRFIGLEVLSGLMSREVIKNEKHFPI